MRRTATTTTTSTKSNPLLSHNLGVIGSVLSSSIASSCMSYSSNTSSNGNGSSNVIRLPCLYTKQITKKRKAWSDGILKISINKGIYFATLLDVEDLRGTGLESRQLEGMEVNKLTNRQSFTLTMDQHLIEVTFEPSSSENSSSVMQISGQKPIAPQTTAGEGSGSGSGSGGGEGVGGRRLLKLPKFVPPSRLVRPSPPLPTPNPAGLHFPSSSANSARNSQPSALDDELDDLWGLAPAPSSVSHSPTLHRPTTTSSTMTTTRATQQTSAGNSHHLLSQYGQSKPAPSQSSIISSVTASSRPNKELDDPKPLLSTQVSTLREKGSIKPVCSSAKQTSSSSFCDWMIESDVDCFYNLSQFPIPTTDPSPPVVDHHNSGGVDDVFGIDDSIWNR